MDIIDELKNRFSTFQREKQPQIKKVGPGVEEFVLRNDTNRELSAFEVAKKIREFGSEYTKEKAIKRILDARVGEMLAYMNHECPSRGCRPMNEDILIHQGRLKGPALNNNIYVCRYRYIHECGESSCYNTSSRGGELTCLISGRGLGSQMQSYQSSHSWKESGGRKRLINSSIQETAEFYQAGELPNGKHARPSSSCNPFSKLNWKNGRIGTRLRGEGSEQRNTLTKRKRATGFCNKKARKKRQPRRLSARDFKVENVTREEKDTAMKVVRLLLYGKIRIEKDIEKLNKIMKAKVQKYVVECGYNVDMNVMDALRGSVINETNPGMSTIFSEESREKKERRVEIYAEWAMRVIKSIQLYMRNGSNVHRINVADYVAAFLYILRQDFFMDSYKIFERDIYLARHMPLFPQLTPMKFSKKKAISIAIQNIKEALIYAVNEGKEISSLSHNQTVYL
jgi:hypothetical protein